MKELLPVSGIITVLNTPFDGQGRVDEASLRRNVQYALVSNVAGFLVPAMASEVYSLEIAERLRMVEIVTEEVAGRVPIFAGAGERDAAPTAGNGAPLRANGLPTGVVSNSV